MTWIGIYYKNQVPKHLARSDMLNLSYTYWSLKSMSSCYYSWKKVFPIRKNHDSYVSSRLCESILEDNFFIYYQVRCIPLTWRSSKIGTDHKLQSSKISSEILVSTDRTSTGKFFFILPAGRVKRLKQDLKFSEALNNLFVSSVQMDTASKIIIYTQMCQLFYLQGRRYKLSIAWVQLDLILNYLIPKYASKSRVQTIFLKTYCFIGLRLYTCQLSQQ